MTERRRERKRKRQGKKKGRKKRKKEGRKLEGREEKCFFFHNIISKIYSLIISYL